MRKMNVSGITQKGAVVDNVRKAIVGTALNDLGVLTEAGWVYYEKERAFALPIQDKDNNTLYATITLTVGTKAPNEKAVKKSTPKPKTDSEPIVIE